jgi:predicted small lipoprotein YifL
MKKTSLFCAVLALALVPVLAGCGQKGPLYLPQPAKPSPDAAKTAPAPKPTPAASGN